MMVDPRERARRVHASLAEALEAELRGDVEGAVRAMVLAVEQYEEDRTFAADGAHGLAGILTALGRVAPALPAAAELYARGQAVWRAMGR